MPNTETQKEIERLQGELQEAKDDLVEVKEKLVGRRNSLDWEQKSGQEKWKKELEEKILQLEAEIARLQATESQTESEFEKKEEILNEWLETFPDLNKEEDADFVFWIIKEQSKDIENFADLKWVKEKVDTRELDLNKLKQGYQEWKTDQEAKKERKRERERERERQMKVDMANEKVVSGETATVPESLGERKEVEKGDNSSEEMNLPLEAESKETLKILIGVVIIAGLTAMATLVVQVIKNRKKGEKTKK
jgi:hypothetical protein